MKHLHSRPQLLEIAMILAHTLKQGSLSLQTNSVEHIQLTIQNNKMNLNFLQKKLLKTLLELGPDPETTEKSTLEKLKMLKNLAEELKQDKLTITVSHKGQTVLTLGCEAKPTISQIATGTNAIEVNNMIELIKLIK